MRLQNSIPGNIPVRGTFAWFRGDAMWRKIDAASAKALIVTVRRAGQTLAEAAAAANIHTATLCRWQNADPAFARSLRKAADFVLRQRYSDLTTALRAVSKRQGKRLRVATHPNCPACSAAVQVRRVCGRYPGVAFWACTRWPQCVWASWRPRHVQDCPTCSGPRFWARSRLSVSCPQCGTREAVQSGSMRIACVISR